MDLNAQVLWQVWRRPKDSREPWEKVPGLLPMEKYAAFRATMEQQWIGSHTDWEYEMVPVGQFPRQRQQHGPRGTFTPGYQTKVMKPR